MYGAVVAIGVDPIEKKPLFHVAPGTTAYSIATAGCPFHCTFCQNWEIAQGPRLGIDLPARRLPPARVVEEALAHGADSIAYTYVEPTVFLEYALDTARLGRAAGLRNLFITDGYATPEAIALLAPVLDAANVDLKSFDDAFYRKLCGGRLAHVLEAIVAMRRAGIWLELTTLVIPGRNDDEAELRALTRWIVDTLGPETPWHVSRFFPAHRMLDVPPDPARDAPPGGRPGPGGRSRARLRRQRTRARPGGHALRRLRARPDRAPRIPGPQPPGSGRHVSGLRSGARRPRAGAPGPAAGRAAALRLR